MSIELQLTRLLMGQLFKIHEKKNNNNNLRERQREAYLGLC